MQCWMLTSGMARLLTTPAPSVGSLATTPATSAPVTPCAAVMVKRASRADWIG